MHSMLAVLLSFVLAASLSPTYAWGDPSLSSSQDASAPVAQTGGSAAAQASDEPADEAAPEADASSTEQAASGPASDAAADAPSPAADEPAESAAQTAPAPAANGEAAAPAAAPGAASTDPQSRVDAAVVALEGLSFYKVKPVYGTDDNVNDVLEAKLADLGFSDVSVRTAKAELSRTDEHFTAGVSAADDDTNGRVTYASYDPGVFSSWALAQYRSVSLEFELSCGGAVARWAQSGNTVLDWDDEACARLLEPYAQGIEASFAAGDSADAVTQQLTLPYKAKAADGSTLRWSEVTWSVSDGSAVKLAGGGYEDYRATPVRAASDTSVTLTATLSVVTSGGPGATVEKTFSVTIKGDPAQAEAAKQELARKLDAAFSADALTYAADGSQADASALTGDVVFPAPRAIGVDGKYYRVEYSVDTDAIAVNGYRGNLYRGLPGTQPLQVKVTAVVADKSNAEISASKTVDVTVAPLDAAQIDAELSLMDEAAQGYAAAILNGQQADAVTGSLHAFQKAYRASDGSLAWSYSASDKAGDGIAPVELDGASETAGYRLFKSSAPAVIKHESLALAQPEYDTQVTVSSRLASERYARYAERYADDAAWGAKFAQLAGRDVSATFTVSGTSGQQAPEVSAALSIVGVDASGSVQTWAAAETYTLARGATAADLSEAAFKAAGIQADYGTGSYGWYLNTVTSPFDGRTLGWDQATGRYWQLFVNGKASESGAGSVTLAPGDSVVWFYSAYGDTLPDEKIAVSGVVYGMSASGVRETWAANTTFSLDKGATAADLSEALFAGAGLQADYGTGQYGWFLNTIVSPFDGRTLGWDQATGRYWQLFVNGKASETGAGTTVLSPGDSVAWCYSAYGEDLPDADDLVADPSAPRPSYDAEHPMFAGSTQGGNVTQAPTPTEGTQLSWAYEYGDGVKSASDPLIVNGNLYIVAGSTIRIVDPATGRDVKTASIGAKTGYFCRPAYADGIVIVPREDGSLAAFIADELTCVWVSDALGALDTHAGNGYQALSSLTVNGHYAYAGFTMAGSLGATNDLSVAGALVCVDTRTGETVWTRVSDSAQTGEAAGYYWAGAAVSGDDIVIGDESGTVSLVDGATGAVLSSVSGLGGAVRAGVVSVPGEPDVFLAVSRDNGTLHAIVREGDALTLRGSVAFAAQSTSTPAVVDGTAFVCGVDEQGYGTVSAIDVASMTVVGGGRGGAGKAQAAPLVSVTGGKTYAYFTCNGRPGGVYAYCLEDDSVMQVYTPDAAHQQYSTSTVIADAKGTLYYSNDSGALFALAGAASWTVSFDTGGAAEMKAAYVPKGSPVARPADPVREGFVFAGWFADAAFTRAWNFDEAPTGDMTLYAKWEKASDGNGGAEGDGNDGAGSGGAAAGDTGAGSQTAQAVVQEALSGRTGAAPSARTLPGGTGGVVQKAADSRESASAADAASAQGASDTEDAAQPAEAVALSASDEAAGEPFPWPWLGLALGVCGLVVAFALRATRRRDER